MGSLQENKAIIHRFLNRWLPLGNETICELGSGKGDNLEWLKEHRPNAHVYGVEIFEPYIEIAQNRGFDIVRADIIDYLWRSSINNNKVHSYLLLDVLEHIDKDDAINMIFDMRCSAEQILIFSPLGVCPQDAYDGNKYQQHLSSWTEKELWECGFKTWVHHDFHEGLPEGASTSVVFAQWDTSHLTELL